MKVTKRDGSLENYSILTVKRAIREAFKTAKTAYNKDTIQSIVNDFILEDKIHVESILNLIEKTLLAHGFFDVAKEFILYRDKKNEIRNWVKSKKLFIERYKKSSNTANSTIDDNSNVSSKNIGVLNAEIHKEDNLQVNRGLIMDKIKELYPGFNSKMYTKDLKSHIIYKNDENSFAGISPYCVSVTMYPFLHDGLSKIGGLSAKPKNLDSFCGMFVNLIFAVASLFAGAVATPEFLVFFDYFAKKEFGDDYYLHYDEFYKIGSDLRTLLNKSGIWFNSIKQLRNYDFGSEELNKLRDKIVYNSERELTDDELKEWEQSAANEEFNPIRLGDSTRTIGSTIHQFFQQVVYSINQPAASRKASAA